MHATLLPSVWSPLFSTSILLSDDKSHALVVLRQVREERGGEGRGGEGRGGEGGEGRGGEGREGGIKAMHQ